MDNKIIEYLKNKSSIFILLIVIIGLILIFPEILFCSLYILNVYSNAVLAIVAILALLFGQSWLNTSKKKMKGKLDYDIARKYFKRVLQLRDAIKIVRRPSVSVSEQQTAVEKKVFNDDKYEDDKVKTNRAVYSSRWDKIQEAWTNLEEILTEAEVSWGNEAVDVQKDLDMLIRKLRSVVWLFVNYPESFYKKWDENSGILYGTHNEDDEFAKKINSEIEKIRIFLKKHL